MKIKNRTLIGGLLAIIFVMAVGYSTFATELRIVGMANIGASWNVHIKSITPETPVGTASIRTNPFVGADGLSATFSTNLLKPNDSLTYTVVIENSGNLDATLSDIIFTKEASDYIDFNYNGISVNERLNSGKTKSFTITSLYKDVDTPPNSDLTSSVHMVLTYVQAR